MHVLGARTPHGGVHRANLLMLMQEDPWKQQNTIVWDAAQGAWVDTVCAVCLQ